MASSTLYATPADHRTGTRVPDFQSEVAYENRARLQRLLDVDVDFIGNASFEDEDAELEILEADSGTAVGTSTQLPTDMPSHLARLCEAELLSADQERALFRRMNFLKFRVDRLRSEIDFDDPDPQLLETAERFLAEAHATRDDIVRANMRLVISVVKKFVTPQCSFDEMLSDGIMTLMNAVEKFDYDRGFRFSTYAYRSIARNAYRSVTARQKDASRFTTSAFDFADAEEAEEGSYLNERIWESLRRNLTEMMSGLDRREQFIIRSRYALGAHRRVRTFQALADRLGVSKERVRQLEQRAVQKLKRMATELPVDEWAEIGMDSAS